jgi:hypothetical protein
VKCGVAGVSYIRNAEGQDRMNDDQDDVCKVENLR